MQEVQVGHTGQGQRLAHFLSMARFWITELMSLLISKRTAVVSGSEDTATLYAASLLAECREEVDRADKKASILLAATGVGIGALLAGLIAGKWSPFQLKDAIQWLWWTGVAATAGGLWYLACAVYPRTRRRGVDKPESVAYFGDVLAFPTTAELTSAIAHSSEVSLTRLADQVRQVSLIVDRKYAYIRRAMWLLFSAAICCALSVLINLSVT